MVTLPSPRRLSIRYNPYVTIGDNPTTTNMSIVPAGRPLMLPRFAGEGQIRLLLAREGIRFIVTVI